MKNIEIDSKKSVYEICIEHPQIKVAMKQAGFTDIVKPGMLETAGRFMTIPKGAAMMKIDFERVKDIFLEYDFILN